MQEHVQDDFDWVGAQAKCNAASMFERLRTRVEEDVRRRNGLLGRPDKWTFEFYSEDDVFEVLLHGLRLGPVEITCFSGEMACHHLRCSQASAT